MAESMKNDPQEEEKKRKEEAGFPDSAPVYRDEDPFLYGDLADFSAVKRATHWMPLPPSPRKGGAACPTTM